MNPYDYPMREGAAKRVQKDTRPWAHLLRRIQALSRNYQYPQQFHQFRLGMRNGLPLSHTAAIHRLLCRLTVAPSDKRVLLAEEIAVLPFSKETESALYSGILEILGVLCTGSIENSALFWLLFCPFALLISQQHESVQLAE